MTKAYKFTFVRRSIFEERFEVEADTLEEAEEMMQDGGYPDPVGAIWIDWYEDEFSTDREFPPEPLCPLYNIVKRYEMSEEEKDQIHNSVVPKLISEGI